MNDTEEQLRASIAESQRIIEESLAKETQKPMPDDPAFPEFPPDPPILYSSSFRAY
jgi:hypothetical protein